MFFNLSKLMKGHAITKSPCSIDLDVDTMAIHIIFKMAKEGNECLKLLIRRADLFHLNIKNSNPKQQEPVRSRKDWKETKKFTSVIINALSNEINLWNDQKN